MAKQKINVIVDMPNPEHTAELLAEGMADIIANRIKHYSPEQQIYILDELMDEIRKKHEKD